MINLERNQTHYQQNIIMRNDQIKIAVLGLGYVGLPLAVEFSKVTHVVGFDIDDERIQSLKSGVDKTKETTSEELLLAKNLIFTSNFQDLDDANVFIVTVPTPIDQHNGQTCTHFCWLQKP